MAHNTRSGSDARLRRRPRVAGPLAVAASLLAFGSAAPAWSQGVGVEVVRQGEALVEAEPRASVTSPFRIVSTASRPLDLREHLILPDGWRTITPPSRIELAPRAARTRLVHVVVPSSASPGAYSIRYGVEGPTGQTAWDSATVVVGERREVAIALIEAPDIVVAGSTYSARYAVTNRGNAVTRLRLRARSGNGVPVRPETLELRLDPGETRELEFSVASLPTVRRSVRHRLEVAAFFVDGDSPAATAAAQVEVLQSTIRVAAGGADRYPLFLKLRSADKLDRRAPFELSGSGALVEDGSVRLDLLARGPSPDIPALGERDEYRLSLTGDRFDLRLGDQRYTLTPLTEIGRYGLGAGGEFRAGNWTAGGHFVTDRHRPDRRQVAASIGYTLGTFGRLGVQHVARLEDDASGAWTLHGRFEPFRYSQVEVEYGASPEVDGSPGALMARFSGGGTLATYNVQLIRADLGYTGVYNGLSRDHAALEVRPWRDLRLRGAFTRADYETNGSISYIGTRGTRSYTAHAGYGPFAAVEVARTERLGWLTSPTGPEIRESVRARVGLRAGTFRLNPSVEFGTVRGGSIAVPAPFRSYTIHSQIEPFSGASLSGRVQYTTSDAPRTAYTQRALSGFLNASVHATSSTRLRLAAFGRRPVGTDDPIHGYLDGGIEQRLPYGHQLALRLRAATESFGWEREPVLFVDYTVPLRVPTFGRSATGGASIRLHDAENGTPIPNVPVRLGPYTAITDKQGRATFENLPPDAYPLQLNRLGLGLDRVAVEDPPEMVTVRPGRTTRIEIGAAASARIHGAIRLFPSRDAAEAADARGRDLPGTSGMRAALLEVSLNGTRRRQLTDAEGRFDFVDLPPGRWTLAVRAIDLPDHHDLDTERIEIELEPGASEPVLLRVVPRHRPLRIVSSQVLDAAAPAGGVRSAPSTASKAAPGSYTVTLVDFSLMNVARRVYGRANLWPKIWVANRNRIPDPDHIESGQHLVIPPAGPLTAEERAAASAYYAERGGTTRAVRSYTVQVTDVSLMNIARKVYGDAALWPKIWVANRDLIPDPDHIESGQVLVIPAAAPLTVEEREARAEYLRGQQR